MASNLKSLANLQPRAKGDPKVVGSGVKKGYKSINVYMRNLLQDRPLQPLINRLSKGGVKIPFENNSELLAWKKLLLCFDKNSTTALAAIKDIEDRVDGKVASQIKGLLNLNVKDMSDKELEAIVNGE